MDTNRIGRILVFLLATSPNWVIGWSMFPAGWGRVPLMFLAISALVCLAYHSWMKKADDGPAGKAGGRGILGIALGIFVLAYAAASLFGIDWQRSFWGEQSRQDGLLMVLNFAAIAIVAPAFLKTERHWKDLYRIVFWSAAVPAAVAIGEVAIPSLRAFYHEGSRFSAWFSNPLFLGGYLAMAAFYGAKLVAGSRGAERYLSAIGLAAVVAGVVATGSRGPLLALVVGSMVAVAVWVLTAGSRKVRSVGIAASAAVALLVLGGFALGARGALPGPVARILAVDSYLEDNVPRLISWGIAWKGFVAKPVLGWGPQNFQTVFDRYYEPELLRYSFYETVSDKPHDLPLEMLATGGTVLGLAFVGLFAAAAAMVVSRRRSGADSRSETALTSGLLVAYLAHTAFLFDAPSTSLLLFLAFGRLMSGPSVSGIAGVWISKIAGSARAVPIAMRKASVAAAVILLVACDAYAGGFGLIASAATVKATDPASLGNPAAWRGNFETALRFPNPYRDELRKYVAFEFLRWEGSGKLPAEWVKQVAPEIRAAVEESRTSRPYDFMTAFVLGQLYTVEGNALASPEILTKAVDAFREARELSPKRQAVPLQLAKVLLLGGKSGEAVELLRQVVSEDETISEPHWFLGLALAADGDREGASREIARSFELGRWPKSRKETLYAIDLFAAAGMYDEIVPLYKMLISQDPENPDWHARLAATYAEMGNPGAAISEAQAAAEIDPSFKDEAESFIKSLNLAP